MVAVPPPVKPLPPVAVAEEETEPVIGVPGWPVCAPASALSPVPEPPFMPEALAVVEFVVVLTTSSVAWANALPIPSAPTATNVARLKEREIDRVFNPVSDLAAFEIL